MASETQLAAHQACSHSFFLEAMRRELQLATVFRHRSHLLSGTPSGGTAP
jgi:hypothetical protein